MRFEREGEFLVLTLVLKQPEWEVVCDLASAIETTFQTTHQGQTGEPATILFGFAGGTLNLEHEDLPEIKLYTDEPEAEGILFDIANYLRANAEALGIEVARKE